MLPSNSHVRSCVAALTRHALALAVVAFVLFTPVIRMAAQQPESPPVTEQTVPTPTSAAAVDSATPQPADAAQSSEGAPAPDATQSAPEEAQTPTDATQQPVDTMQPQPADGTPPADATAPVDGTAPAADGTIPADAKSAVPPKKVDPFLDAGSFSERGPSIITEELLKVMLVGKRLYLRSGYLSDNLTFNEHGGLVGHSPEGSYTLCNVQITNVTLLKHKVVLEGTRYGMHFLGALPSEEAEKSVALIRLAPPKMKKTVHITIDREQIVKPPKVKRPKVHKLSGKAATAARVAAADKAKQEENTKVEEILAKLHADRPIAAAKSADILSEATASAAAAPYTSEVTAAALAQAAEAAKPEVPEPTPTSPEAKELTPEEQAKAEIAASIAAAPPEERPIDTNTVTHTTSPVHAARVLRKALDNAFSVGLDRRMLDAMPDYWKHYYEAQASRIVYRPKDPGIARPRDVDTLPSLITSVEPDSNTYAQASGITGPSLYRVIIGANGEIGDIAVMRPIGFGLDENAVAAIRKATFKPAIQNGQPIATYADLFITFRIYSKRTALAAAAAAANKDHNVADSRKKEHKLPGPYTLLHPATAPPADR